MHSQKITTRSVIFAALYMFGYLLLFVENMGEVLSKVLVELSVTQSVQANRGKDNTARKEQKMSNPLIQGFEEFAQDLRNNMQEIDDKVKLPCDHTMRDHATMLLEEIESALADAKSDDPDTASSGEKDLFGLAMELGMIEQAPVIMVIELPTGMMAEEEMSPFWAGADNALLN